MATQKKKDQKKKKTKRTWKEIVIIEMLNLGEATAAEVYASLTRRHVERFGFLGLIPLSSVSSAFSQLVLEGALVPTGKRRPLDPSHPMMMGRETRLVYQINPDFEPVFREMACRRSSH